MRQFLSVLKAFLPYWLSTWLHLSRRIRLSMTLLWLLYSEINGLCHKSVHALHIVFRFISFHSTDPFQLSFVHNIITNMFIKIHLTNTIGFRAFYQCGIFVMFILCEL